MHLTVPGTIPAPRKLYWNASAWIQRWFTFVLSLQDQVPGTAAYNTQGEKSLTIKCCSLCWYGKTEKLKGEKMRKPLNDLALGTHLLLPPSQRLLGNWVLPAKMGSRMNFKSCTLNTDENQIIHSHAVAIFVCSCGSFTQGLKLFWLKWANKYPKFGTSVIGSQRRL